MKLHRLLSFALLATASFSFGQWDVNKLSANTVKAGTNWGSSRMRLDTLDLDIRVSGGLVRTRATMTWTPETLLTITSRAVTNCATTSEKDTTVACQRANIVYDTLKNVVADSLEMRGYLNLPSDAAVSGMWLWVGEEKVAAYVMDRWKAAQQYSQIVGARRDPALLETRGNGSYNLSLFPLKSGETRKLQIEIVQALKDGLVLPIAARSTFQRWNSLVAAYVIDTIRPGVVRLSMKGDGKTETVFDLGGLGKFEAGLDSISKTWTRPDSVVAVAKGKVPEVWTAMRDGKGAFGAATTFKGMDLAFAPEPNNRLVVLDAADSLDRCRKLALLSLLKYGKAPHKVNLVWMEEDGLRHLWPTPVSIDDAAAAKALSFLKSWKPAVKPDAKRILREVAKSDTGAVLVLVSTSPYEYSTLAYPGYSSDTASGLYKAYIAYVDSNTRFNKRLNDAWNTVGQELSAARLALFGWWNDHRAASIATLTGGYSFGTVMYPWYRWWIQADSIAAPALFGPRRCRYRENPANLKVEIEGIETDSLAYMFRTSSGGWWWGGPWIMASTSVDVKVSIAARTAAEGSAYSVVYDDSLPVFFAARYAKGGQVTLKLSGIWGGLGFSGTRKFQVPDPTGTEWGTRVWAGEYANMAQPYIWTDTLTQAAVRRLGKDYQIVTPATSFLALEPGMKPLDSLAGQTTGTSDVTVPAAETNDAKWANVALVEGPTSTDGASFDATGLDDLLAGRIVSVKRLATPAVVGLRIRSGSTVDLEVLGHDDGSATVRIVDLNGREVAKMSMTRSGDRWTSTWKPTGRGVFFAVAEGSRWKHTSRFTAGR